MHLGYLGGLGGTERGNVPLCPTSVDKLMNSNVNVPKVLVLPVVKAKHIGNY